MKTIKVIPDGAGMAKAKNTHDRNAGLEENESYKDFEKTNPPLPILKGDLPYLELGEVEVQIGYQYELNYMGMKKWAAIPVPINELHKGFNTRKVYNVITPQVSGKQPEIKDASYYEMLTNVYGKEQDGINFPLLKLWGEVEKWFGDPKKSESGRTFLLRIQSEFEISIKDLNKYQDTRKASNIPVINAHRHSETVDQAAEKYRNDFQAFFGHSIPEHRKEGFLDGAKWQSQQQGDFKGKVVKVLEYNKRLFGNTSCKEFIIRLIKAL